MNAAAAYLYYKEQLENEINTQMPYHSKTSTETRVKFPDTSKVKVYDQEVIGRSAKSKFSSVIRYRVTGDMAGAIESEEGVKILKADYGNKVTMKLGALHAYLNGYITPAGLSEEEYQKFLGLMKTYETKAKKLQSKDSLKVVNQVLITAESHSKSLEKFKNDKSKYSKFMKELSIQTVYYIPIVNGKKLNVSRVAGVAKQRHEIDTKLTIPMATSATNYNKSQMAGLAEKTKYKRGTIMKKSQLTGIIREEVIAVLEQNREDLEAKADGMSTEMLRINKLAWTRIPGWDGKGKVTVKNGRLITQKGSVKLSSDDLNYIEKGGKLPGADELAKATDEKPTNSQSEKTADQSDENDAWKNARTPVDQDSDGKPGRYSADMDIQEVKKQSLEITQDAKRMIDVIFNAYFGESVDPNDPNKADEMMAVGETNQKVQALANAISEKLYNWFNNLGIYPQSSAKKDEPEKKEPEETENPDAEEDEDGLIGLDDPAIVKSIYGFVPDLNNFESFAKAYNHARYKLKVPYFKFDGHHPKYDIFLSGKKGSPKLSRQQVQAKIEAAK